MRVVMCSDSHCRIRLLANCPSVRATCAMRIITTKFRLPVPIPTSTMDCVRKGRIRFRPLATSIASTSCTK